MWGRIVGANRVLQISDVQFFGFAEGLPTSLTFGDARFSGYSAELGFAEASDIQAFNEGTFAREALYQGVDGNAGAGAFYAGGQVTSNYALSDKEYLRLIYAKARANISSGSIQDINKILLSLFPGRGNCYVQEGSLPEFFGFAESSDAAPFGQEVFYFGQALPRMQYQIVFRFPLAAVDLAIVQNSGVLPKTAGVQSNISILP